jgi:phosphoserine aminotransferase
VQVLVQKAHPLLRMNPNSLNFSGGPGALPLPVLEQLSAEMRIVPEVGLSLLGISHRSDWFAAVVDEVEQTLRRLLALTDDWHVLLMQGGSSLQFGMIPMNFLAEDSSADYVLSGYWSRRSLADPVLYGSARLAWDGAPWGFSRLPSADELELDPQAAYFHYVSNETVEGLQFHAVPGLGGVRRICDMSSDFLSRPIAVDCFDLIYAHAQKNLGPAGLTIVLIRQRMLEHLEREVPSMLDYRSHCDHGSIFNTPPTFAIYATLLVLRWLEQDAGGLQNVANCNQKKASLIYDAIDHSDGFYRGWAAKENRSLMNVSFQLADRSQETAFLHAAAEHGFTGLCGHRSLGGLRASLYNAVSLDACEELASFMLQFRLS